MTTPLPDLSDLSGLSAAYLRALRAQLPAAIEAAELREQVAYLGDPDAIARRMVGDDGLIRHLPPHERDDVWSLVVGGNLPKRVEGVRRYIADAIRAAIDHDRKQRGGGVRRCIADAIRAAIDHDRKQRGGGWRPASEPPGSDRNVLVALRGGAVLAGYYSHGASRWYMHIAHQGTEPTDKVRFWYDAPPPPEGAR